MMTAAQIAKELGLSKITINHRLAEWLDESFYDNDPIKPLNLLNKSKDHLVATFLDGIDFEDSRYYFDEISKTYPENKKQVISRVGATL
jgi:hypothetical protein